MKATIKKNIFLMKVNSRFTRIVIGPNGMRNIWEKCWENICCIGGIKVMKKSYKAGDRLEMWWGMATILQVEPYRGKYKEYFSQVLKVSTRTGELEVVV
jgi:hypothetical protein